VPILTEQIGQSVRVRHALAVLGFLLFAAGGFAAWDQPQPEGGSFSGNPCDGSIAAAFESVEDDGSDPFTTEFCRDPARRQLAVAALLLACGSFLVLADPAIRGVLAHRRAVWVRLALGVVLLPFLFMGHMSWLTRAALVALFMLCGAGALWTLTHPLRTSTTSRG
jgi:hypothetical protein